MAAAQMRGPYWDWTGMARKMVLDSRGLQLVYELHIFQPLLVPPPQPLLSLLSIDLRPTSAV